MLTSWKSLVASFVFAIVNYFTSLGPNLPKTGEDWGHALVSAAMIAFGALVKDWNVSNAPAPTAPNPVSASDASKANPSAPIL